jgi:hypothetical protein
VNVFDDLHESLQSQGPLVFMSCMVLAGATMTVQTSHGTCEKAPKAVTTALIDSGSLQGPNLALLAYNKQQAKSSVRGMGRRSIARECGHWQSKMKAKSIHPVMRWIHTQLLLEATLGLVFS